MVDLEGKTAEVETKNILLHARELADIYALKSLYDFLAHQILSGGLNINLFFGGNIDTARSRDVLASVPTREQFMSASIDESVGCYSDLRGNESLDVDISILKNSVIPLSNKERMELRKKYSIPSDRPVLVIGYSDKASNLARIAEDASKFATVYLVGYEKGDNLGLSKEAEKRVHLITQDGILKDYYAIADVAINGNNVSSSSAPLHNFVEATEGGPLFMVPSSNTAQYGYKQLVNAGVIIECDDLNDLIDKLTDYLQNFGGNTRVLNARARHLTHTRDIYFPVILEQLRRIIGEEVKIPESDLITIPTGRGVRLMHPDSEWEDGTKLRYDDNVPKDTLKTKYYGYVGGHSIIKEICIVSLNNNGDPILQEGIQNYDILDIPGRSFFRKESTFINPLSYLKEIREVN